MAHFKNKKIYKVMYAPHSSGIIWEIGSETPISHNSFLYILLNKRINFESWRTRYATKNKDFFEKGDDSIFTLKDRINLSMINALLRLNDQLKDIAVYYWFDVDRTIHEDFKWTHCPLSKEPLVGLGIKYPNINALVSAQHPLIFPNATM